MFITAKLAETEDVLDLEGRVVYDATGRALKGNTISPAGGSTLPPGSSGWGT